MAAEMSLPKDDYWVEVSLGRVAAAECHAGNLSTRATEAADQRTVYLVRLLSLSAIPSLTEKDRKI